VTPASADQQIISMSKPAMLSQNADPTPATDPLAYLALRKFSQKITCPVTKLPVSFADIGDPYGEALLWMMPSGGSRWFAAAHGGF
jgi:hypothetical protein